MPTPSPRVSVRTRKAAIVGLSVIILSAIVAATVAIYQWQQPPVQTINYSQLYSLAQTGGAVALAVEGETLTVTKADGSLVQATVTGESTQHEVVQLFLKSNVPVEFRPLQPGLISNVVSWLLPILTLGLIGFAGWRVYASMSGRGSFELENHNGKQDVGFADVAGVDEARAELTETIEFLRSPERFSRLGGRVPRGILLYGPPGTGKTLLARAAAKEAGVAFLSASGSSFQEKFAGLGAARVRHLFAKGRKLSPCIIFIDEIDALGRQRGRGGDSASADQDQTLNQLLVEMDGFDQSSAVVVIASTNRPDILDKALTRPGRFDREIAVNLADVSGREAILKVHARNLKLEDGLDLQWIARGTPGFSGAELANLMNEAAIAATRDDASAIARQHIEIARDRILMGAERQGFMMDEDERYATAVHEAGHVAVGLAVENGDPIHKVSILPRGRALGVTQSLPERDRFMKKREYLEDQIALLLGGRAAEQVLLSTMTAGASNDIERAVEIARRMVSEFGMSRLGPIHLGQADQQRSQSLLDKVEEATTELINEQLERACRIVTAEQESIARLVELLMERDTLDADEIAGCFDRQSVRAA
ncbi:MAG TPA: ATP-dependent zinc metalloprotease FtsH [Pyrinomonadaceae bacterium]|jgi:cell division protease FtsH|nr:ATP-dependent zinc metalloprotease FtsH [Pyrinomonadaceae bacterium]